MDLIIPFIVVSFVLFLFVCCFLLFCFCFVLFCFVAQYVLLGADEGLFSLQVVANNPDPVMEQVIY